MYAIIEHHEFSMNPACIAYVDADYQIWQHSIAERELSFLGLFTSTVSTHLIRLLWSGKRKL